MAATQARRSHPLRLLQPQRLRALSPRIDREGLRQCAGHIGLLAVTTALVYAASGWWLIPAMLAHGIALVALFAPLHEASHQTVFRTHRANRALAFLAGLVLMLPPTWFFRFHLAHHRYTQDVERDPELAEPKPRTLARYAWIITGIPYWRSALANLARLSLGRVQGMDYVSARQTPAIVREARVFVGVYAATAAVAIALSSMAPLTYWLLPVLMGQPFLRLYLLAEHTGCAETDDGLTNTRTTLASAPVRWLMWNMPYHAEHHLYPSVPFHALPALHRDIREHLRVVAPGYPAAHRDIRRSFRRH